MRTKKLVLRLTRGIAIGAALGFGIPCLSQAEEIRDCRIFIERASARSAEHGVEYLHLFLKTHDGFDSTILSIEFHGSQHYALGGHNYMSPYESVIKNFPGAGDYWELELPITSDINPGIGATSVTGRFVVTTVKGTQYILHAVDPEHFLRPVEFSFDSKLYAALRLVMDKEGIPASDFSQGGPPIESTIVTRTELPYLNPYNCQ